MQPGKPSGLFIATFHFSYMSLMALWTPPSSETACQSLANLVTRTSLVSNLNQRLACRDPLTARTMFEVLPSSGYFSLSTADVGNAW